MLNDIDPSLGRAFMSLVANSSQAQCRTIAEHLLALAEVPRDAAWQAFTAKALESFPAPPEDGLAAQIRAARARVAEDETARRAALLGACTCGGVASIIMPENAPR